MPKRIAVYVTAASAAYLCLLAAAVLGSRWILASAWYFFGLFFLDAFWPKFDLAGETRWRGPRRGKKIALTFDDGPDPRFTPAILDELRNLGIKATFFVLGRHVKEHPELFRRILAEGHEVGSHGFSHQKFTWMGPRAIENDLKAWEEAAGLKPEEGKPLWLRPPHGLKNSFVRKTAKKLGYRIAAWSRGVWDTDRPGAETIAARATKGVRPGEILLLHDGDGSGCGGDRSQTAAAVPAIVNGLKGRGFSFATVSELLEEAEPGWAWGQVFFGTFVTAALLIYIAGRFDLAEVGRNLSLPHPRFLLMSLALDFLCLFAKSQMWRQLVLPLSPVPVFRAFGIYLIGGMLNNILPFRAGDISRVHLLGKEADVKKTHGASTVLLEIVLDGVSFLPILLLAAFFSPIPSSLFKAAVYFSAVVLAAFSVLFAAAPSSDHPWLAGLQSLKQRKRIAAAGLLSAFGWFFYLASLLCMMRACGLSVSVWAAPVLALFLAAGMFIPATPGRLGTFEGTVAVALALFHVPAPQAIAFGLILHTTQTLPSILYGTLSWVYSEILPHRKKPANVP